MHGVTIVVGCNFPLFTFNIHIKLLISYLQYDLIKIMLGTNINFSIMLAYQQSPKCDQVEKISLTLGSLNSLGLDSQYYAIFNMV